VTQDAISSLPADFDTTKTYYLAGPMTGYTEYNYPHFAAVEAVLQAQGVKVESPHNNLRPKGHEFMSEIVLWRKMMEAGEDQMRRCQGIIMLKGWQNSHGATQELHLALALGWPIFYYREDLTVPPFMLVKESSV